VVLCTHTSPTCVDGGMSIFAGNDRTFLVTEEGVLYAWGNTDHGALGIANLPVVNAYSNAVQRHITYPVWVGDPDRFDGSPVTTVACGFHHTVAVTKSGAVWAWGTGAQGQLGTGALMQSSVPVRVAVGDRFHRDVKVVMAVCSATRTILLGVDGSVWFMGEGDKVLGPTNWTTTRLIDPAYFLGEKIVMVSVETNNDRASVPGDVFYAVGEKGGLFMWGRWEVHGLRTIIRPQKMDTMKYSPHKVVMIQSSASATHVMLNTGYVCEIGRSSSMGSTLAMGKGRLHNNTLEYPRLVRQRMFSTGNSFMVSVDVDGNLYALGHTFTGAMGLGALHTTILPVALNMWAFHGEKFATVSCGHTHTVALTEAGHIYVWGTMGSTKLDTPTAFNFPSIGHFQPSADSDRLLAFAQSHHDRMGEVSSAFAIAREAGILQEFIAPLYLGGSPTCPPWLSVHAYNGICRTLGVKECMTGDT